MWWSFANTALKRVSGQGLLYRLGSGLWLVPVLVLLFCTSLTKPEVIWSLFIIHCWNPVPTSMVPTDVYRRNKQSLFIFCDVAQRWLCNRFYVNFMLRMWVYTAVIISISRKVKVSQKQGGCQGLIHMGQHVLFLPVSASFFCIVPEKLRQQPRSQQQVFWCKILATETCTRNLPVWTRL